jgi:hypothetical protein
MLLVATREIPWRSCSRNFSNIQPELFLPCEQNDFHKVFEYLAFVRRRREELVSADRIYGSDSARRWTGSRRPFPRAVLTEAVA